MSTSIPLFSQGLKLTSGKKDVLIDSSQKYTINLGNLNVNKTFDESYLGKIIDSNEDSLLIIYDSYRFTSKEKPKTTTTSIMFDDMQESWVAKADIWSIGEYLGISVYKKKRLITVIGTMLFFGSFTTLASTLIVKDGDSKRNLYLASGGQFVIGTALLIGKGVKKTYTLQEMEKRRRRWHFSE